MLHNYKFPNKKSEGVIYIYFILQVERVTLDYADVHFSKRTTILRSSAPRGNHGDDVIYAEPRTHEKPGNV